MRSNLSEYSEAIFLSKGIGIILVVIGHYTPTIHNYRMPHYWLWIHDFVYTFHMPLFMFLSGFLYAATKSIDSLSQWFMLIKNKMIRLLIPFISIATIIFIFKFIGGLLIDLKYPISIQSVENIIFDPIESFAPILWFLYVLFEVFITYSLVQYIMGNDLIVLLIFILLLFLPSLDLFMLGTLLYYLPIFAIGFIFCRHNLLSKYRLTIGIISLLSFILLFICKGYVSHPDIAQRIVRLLLGVLGSVSCFFISIQLLKKDNRLVKTLISVGIYSMGIYLLHTIFTGVLQAILLNVIKLSDYWFASTAIIIVSASVLFPILIDKYLIRRYSILNKFIFGITK